MPVQERFFGSPRTVSSMSRKLRLVDQKEAHVESPAPSVPRSRSISPGQASSMPSQILAVTRLPSTTHQVSSENHPTVCHVSGWVRSWLSPCTPAPHARFLMGTNVGRFLAGLRHPYVDDTQAAGSKSSTATMDFSSPPPPPLLFDTHMGTLTVSILYPRHTGHQIFLA